MLHLESMSGGLCDLSLDVMWNFFEYLAWQQWQSENASESFVCPSSDPYDLHLQSPCVDHFRYSYHPHFSYSDVARSNYQSSDPDVNSCPFYMFSDDGFVRLNHMIEAMNEQNAKLENFIWEQHLSLEIDPSLPSSRPKVSLCDDDESSFSSKLDFAMDTPLPDLEKVTNTPLTPLLHIAPSSLSTHRDTAEGILNLPISPFPLA